MQLLNSLIVIAEHFQPGGKPIESVQELGNGNVNDTYLVTVDAPHDDHFILQRINTRVFHRPELVMQNMRCVTEHVERRMAAAPLEAGRCWQLPRVLLTRHGQDLLVAEDGSFWRALSFIGGALAFDTVQHERHAREVGRALGTFHHMVHDLPLDKLADTLPGFHITPRYLRHYDDVRREKPPRESREVDYCSQFVRRQRGAAHVLEQARAEGKLQLRPIHGDPKVNNVMIDSDSGQAVGMVDLDTVKLGLIQYDIGDCLRSCCNPLGEETEQWEKVYFDLGLCRAILQGYFAMAGKFLAAGDYPYIYHATRVIAFELGLRFFTDYLEGNVYFKANHSEHNLHRALVQFKLCTSIEMQAAAIQALIQNTR